MAAELVLALTHMHSRYIVYRDLKPAKPNLCTLPEDLTCESYP